MLLSASTLQNTIRERDLLRENILKKQSQLQNKINDGSCL